MFLGGSLDVGRRSVKRQWYVILSSRVVEREILLSNS